MGRFDGQVAVVTGGATGIGFAIAGALAAEGAHVFIAGRDEEKGARAADALTKSGDPVTFVRTDVTDDGQVAALAVRAAQEHGAVEIWCNNAGTEGHTGAFTDADDADVRQVLDTNFKGVYSGMRYAVQHMPQGGVIVNIASFVGTKMPVPVSVAYGGTKAAVVSMTQAVAAGMPDGNVDVFALCPYIVDTPMVDRLTGGQGPSARAAFAAGFAPSGRLTTPDEVAEVVVALCSRTTGHPSGTVLVVDAGPAVVPF